MVAGPEEALREGTAPGINNKRLFYLRTESKARMSIWSIDSPRPCSAQAGDRPVLPRAANLVDQENPPGLSLNGLLKTKSGDDGQIDLLEQIKVPGQST
jgi:hypothetical protein